MAPTLSSCFLATSLCSDGDVRHSSIYCKLCSYEILANTITPLKALSLLLLESINVPIKRFYVVIFCHEY